MPITSPWSPHVRPISIIVGYIMVYHSSYILSVSLFYPDYIHMNYFPISLYYAPIIFPVFSLYSIRISPFRMAKILALSFRTSPEPWAQLHCLHLAPGRCVMNLDVLIYVGYILMYLGCTQYVCWTYFGCILDSLGYICWILWMCYCLMFEWFFKSDVGGCLMLIGFSRERWFFSPDSLT